MWAQTATIRNCAAVALRTWTARARTGISHEQGKWLDLAPALGARDRARPGDEAVDRSPLRLVRALHRTAGTGYHACVQQRRGFQFPGGCLRLAAVAFYRPGLCGGYRDHRLDEAPERAHPVAAVLRAVPDPGRRARKCARPLADRSRGRFHPGALG